MITSADSLHRLQGVHDGLGGECDREGAAPAEPLRIRARITGSIGTTVILSAAKNLARIAGEILRFAQDDDQENDPVISTRILTVKRRNRQGAFMRRSLNDVRPSRE